MPNILPDTPLGYVEMQIGEIITEDTMFFWCNQGPWTRYRETASPSARRDIGIALGHGYVRHARPETHEEFTARAGYRLPAPPAGWCWLAPGDIIPRDAYLLHPANLDPDLSYQLQDIAAISWGRASGYAGRLVSLISPASVLVPLGFPRGSADSILASAASHAMGMVSRRPPSGVRRATVTPLNLP